jgi:hypothetical protein
LSKRPILEPEPEPKLESDPERIEGHERVLERSGVIAVRDTDGDGISDYDENHVYHTNPHNPFTSGSVLADGERVLLGLDVHATDTIPVAVESPKVRGSEEPELFAVHTVELVEGETTKVAAAETSGMLRVRGTAQPLSFVTLYVYSTPVVITVRADAAGRFEYTFEESFEDGSHELYVASVNNSGKILAKSSPVPFVKMAEAVSFTPPPTSADPVERARHNGLAILLSLLLVVAVGSLLALGLMKGRHHEAEAVTVPDHDA